MEGKEWGGGVENKKEKKRKAEKVLSIREGDLPMLPEYFRGASALW